MSISFEDRDFLMKYLDVLTKLQDADVKVNNEINDVVATLHESIGLHDNRKIKYLSKMSTVNLHNELIKRDGVDNFTASSGDIVIGYVDDIGTPRSVRLSSPAKIIINRD
ncbi:hypothetical protein [Aquibacillus saliphilus]|uniref:hypothetical protein n=1 Tax=Aquibacillus saliphilus TaxID=1909422 RepID=UPI001CF01F79|nr:hypothetical protein [Aquibacillus saliphilus]